MAADLSIAQARRLALASLGFVLRRPAKAGTTHVRAALDGISVAAKGDLAKPLLKALRASTSSIVSSLIDTIDNGA